MNLLGERKIPFIFIIDFELLKPMVFKLDEIKEEEIFYNINGFTNFSKEFISIPEIKLRKKTISFFEFYKKIKEVKKECIKGNTYLLNLTFKSEIKFLDNRICLFDIFQHSKAKYKLYVKDNFVVFSPETFIKIEDEIIKTFPMKGTIKAKYGVEKLLEDKKELAEHITVVDLLRNDLGKVANNVWVERFRYVERIHTSKGDLFATSSEVCGKLPKDYKKRIGDIIFSLLPAGSVSGAPKPKTLEIIRMIEGEPREYYCGVFGYFDGEKLDSAVMIRFVEKKEDKFYYRSGCGITIYSNPIKEYIEMRDKIYVPVGGKYLS
ncbi:MAG: aminodeoxychorismate synthase component I, partial [Brevinematales bacterium]|nr:aminodeoxychorismate synthase component I [Brevinematales bacterium]